MYALQPGERAPSEERSTLSKCIEVSLSLSLAALSLSVSRCLSLSLSLSVCVCLCASLSLRVCPSDRSPVRRSRWSFPPCEFLSRLFPLPHLATSLALTGPLSLSLSPSLPPSLRVQAWVRLPRGVGEGPRGDFSAPRVCRDLQLHNLRTGMSRSSLSVCLSRVCLSVGPSV